MRRESGVVLIETVLIGFGILAILLPLLLAVGAVAQARTYTSTEAADIAVWYARHGAMPEVPDGVVVEVDHANDVIAVRVAVDVEVLPVLGVGPSVSISSTATAPVSPYRSARHG